MKSMMFILACLVQMALISGCGTTSNSKIPLELQYIAPAADVPAATIRGSERKDTLFDNFTAYIVTIDGKLVMAERKGWDTPIPLEAGHRALSVKFVRGGFTARTDFDLDAVANANYELKFSTDVRIFADNCQVNFWIIDMATAKAVSPIKQVSVLVAR